MNRPNNRSLLFLLSIGLLVVTALTYWPVLQNDFVNYDDPDYVLLNDNVNRGLSWSGIKWAFTEGHASNWHPITWLSHMLDVSLFGLRPMGHHLTNLVFHCANTVLLLLLLNQMTSSIWRSTLVAALFALHPLHVESVAWVAERKDMLSAFFGILTLMAYAAYARSKVEGRRSRAKYAAALLLFALGLMSKPMLVTWPFVMLLLDFWPLGRVTSEAWRVTGKAWQKLFWEKIPFFVLVIASCLITLSVQKNAMSSVASLPLEDRIGNAALAYGNYLKQTFVPTKLAIFYPHVVPPPTESVMLASACLLAVTVAVLLRLKPLPFGVFGWFWYVGTLIPVIGIVQVGGQARADRYTYLPLIGIFILLAWGTNALLTNRAGLKKLFAALIVLAVGSCALLTRQQLRHWKNSETLFTHATQVTEGNYIARAGLGIVEFRRDNYDQAIEHLNKAQEMVPPGLIGNQIRYYIGATLQKQGKGIAALPYFEQAPEVGILQPEREYRYGLSLIEAGRLDEAERALDRASKAKPDNADFLLGRATLLHSRGKNSEAELIFKEITSRHPTNWLGHYLYGNYLIWANRSGEADASLRQAVSLRTNDITLRQNYALNLARLGRANEAIREFQTCVSQQPNNPELLANLGEQFIQAGRMTEGITAYEQALQLNPDYLPALNNLAWLLATHNEAKFRNGKRAIELGERACKITDWKVPVLMGTLAAAYAEAGQFAEAITTASKARDLAQQTNQTEVAKRNGELLELYKSGRPARD